jgi:adenylyltransferase/sulfurtransferase
VLASEFRTVRWSRNPACPVCGDRPTVTQLIDYEQFCGLPGRAHAAVAPAAATGAAAPEVDADEAHRMVQAGAQLIDVREPWEWAMSRIPGAILIPMGEVAGRTSELDPNRPLVIHCAGGVRSGKVVEALRRAGFENAVNLAGGIIEWTNRRLPTETGG